MRKSSKAVFIDKDGTIIPDIPYNANPDLITISDDVIKGLKSLKENGFWLFIVTNQSGIAKGYFTEKDLEEVKRKIAALLAGYGIQLDGFYYCPHHPDGIIQPYAIECLCKKPKPGMIIEAAATHQIDLSHSWMIGDILHDVEAGNRAGCNTILLNNGNETEWMTGDYRTPDYTVSTFFEAAEVISKALT